MEITDMNIMSDFEAGMKCLQNPSLLSRFAPLPDIERLPPMYSFRKWGALIFAIFAACTGVIKRIKHLVPRIRFNSLSPTTPLTQLLLDDDDFDFSDDDLSVCSSLDDDDDDLDSTSSFEDWDPVDEDFRVAGSSPRSDGSSVDGKLNQPRRNRFSWSDFSAGKSVVKLWDSFGLNLEFEEDSSVREISLSDLNEGTKLSSIFGRKTVVASSPAVFLPAKVDGDGGLGAYDRRIARKFPAVYAEWAPRRPNVLGLGSGGGEKVYVIDGVTGGLTVGDMRNPKTPLAELTKSDGDTWWDADAIIFEDECERDRVDETTHRVSFA